MDKLNYIIIGFVIVWALFGLYELTRPRNPIDVLAELNWRERTGETEDPDA